MNLDKAPTKEELIKVGFKPITRFILLYRQKGSELLAVVDLKDNEFAINSYPLIVNDEGISLSEKGLVCYSDQLTKEIINDAFGNCGLEALEWGEEKPKEKDCLHNSMFPRGAWNFYKHSPSHYSYFGIDFGLGLNREKLLKDLEGFEKEFQLPEREKREDVLKGIYKTMPRLDDWFYEQAKEIKKERKKIYDKKWNEAVSEHVKNVSDSIKEAAKKDKEIAELKTDLLKTGNSHRLACKRGNKLLVEVEKLREELKKHEEGTVIAYIQPSVSQLLIEEIIKENEHLKVTIKKIRKLSKK